MNKLSSIVSQLQSTDDEKTVKKYSTMLFKCLVSEYNFRNNKYIYCGSVDLSHWVCLCFNKLRQDNEELFKAVHLLIAYLSIVDDACDEKITQSSINEMKTHLDIFLGKPCDCSNPAIKMCRDIIDMINNLKFSHLIKEELMKFLHVGVSLLINAMKGLKEQQYVTQEHLDKFLEDKRVDSMALLFITINLATTLVESNARTDEVNNYINLSCDVISLLNDVASIAKDAKKVTNNYVIMHHGYVNHLSIEELQQCEVEEFANSLNHVLDLVSSKLDEMKNISKAHPQQKDQLDAIEEILKGYSTWCFTSKRFQREDHLLEQFIPKEKSAFEKAVGYVLYPFKKPFIHDDMNTYFDDIELQA